MPTDSPLEHSELRFIEKTLDEGNTTEAAARLGLLADAVDHKDAIDFLTIRLLFQRGRIDSDGAADRLGGILERVEHFPEAEDWLSELEARTERNALGEVPATGSSPGDNTAADLTPTRPPPSRAPSVPRKPERLHPYFGELDSGEDEEEVTPTESIGSARAAPDLPVDSSEPPQRPRIGELMGTEPPARPDAARAELTGWDPPTRPDVKRHEPLGVETPPRPTHMPFDSLRAKERLSSEAGRYRGGNDGAPEITGTLRNSRSSAAARNSRSPAAARNSGSPAAARNSGRAPPDVERRIIEVLRCAKDAQWDRARALLPDEPAPPNLRPELRTALAKVLLELGLAERASLEATLALDHAPDDAETRLIFVWSAVRYSRQRDDAWSLERAARILKDLHQSSSHESGLIDSLNACVEARVGIPAVALRLAQRALRANADSMDGLAALAEAAALCGEEPRAEAALERLFGVSESSAEQLAPRLRRLGVGEHGPTSSASVWLPLEHTLSSGARELALAGVEALADEALAHLPILLLGDTQASARAALQFFTLAPVLRHFGPYDSSLKSLDRLEAGLGMLYGMGPHALDAAGVSHALCQLAGLYLGETLRHCCGGQWEGPPGPFAEAKLMLLGFELQPFQLIRHRIIHGRHAMLRSALGRMLEQAPESAHRFRSPVQLAPPPPWGDRDWPSTEELPRFGRALAHSVVAVYAAEQAQVSLDRSLNSLRGLDQYLELVAPLGAPLLEDSAWARWLAVFLGAYLGEVLCKELGGVWGAAESAGAEAFVIELPERTIAPAAVLMATLCGRQVTRLTDFVAQLQAMPAPP
jgi:hypothetical protein